MGYTGWAWNMGDNMKLVSFDLDGLIFKTGQTTSYVNYDDGYYEKGRRYPGTRFIDIDDTIFDNATGLHWLKYANTYTGKTWIQACALYDGVWRVPNILEFLSLVNYESSTECVPSSIFGSSWAAWYTSNTVVGSTTYAAIMIIDTRYGECAINQQYKSSTSPYSPITTLVKGG